MKSFKILIIILLSFFSLNTFCQEKNKSKIDEEKFKAEKVAFLTEKIGLTVQEAQGFWPVFNEYDEKMSKLFEEECAIFGLLEQKSTTLSDKEINEKTDRLIELKIERAKLEKEYYENYKKILPAKKIALLYQSNKEFRKYLMKKYSEKQKSE